MHLVYQLMLAGNMESSEFRERYIDHALLARVRAAFSGAIIWCGGLPEEHCCGGEAEHGDARKNEFSQPLVNEDTDNPDADESAHAEVGI